MVEDCDWHDLEPWYNDRILDTFISSDEVDLHGDHISPEIFEKILPWFQKYGYYEWQHEGIVIGKILGWRFKDGKPQIRVGIHDSTESNIPIHDEVWTKIKSMGLKGMSSIKGIANDQKPMWDGTTSINEITDIGMWGVGWVGDDAANTGATVTFIDEMAKGMIAKSKEAHDRIVKEYGKMEKERKYVKNPSEAPEGASVQQGERGGYYYETGGKKPTGDKKPTTGKPITDKDKKQWVARLFESGEGKLTDDDMVNQLESAGFDNDEAKQYVSQREKIDSPDFAWQDLETPEYTEPEGDGKRVSGFSNKSLNHSPKNDEQELMKEYEKLEKEVTTMTENIETKKRLDDLQLKVKNLLGKLEKADVPPVGDAPPGDEKPKDEGNQDTVAALSADIDKLATAIEALEPGTPEAVAEAVTIAAEVKQGAPDESVEMQKTLETLTKKLTDMSEKYEKFMSAPLTKTAKTPVKPTVQVDGTDSIESITKALQKGKGEQNKIWTKYGFNRMK